MTEYDGGDAPIEVPIDGSLDLHTFSPREIKELIPEYLDACRKRGIDQVRIVHGKGTGALRQSVHALLGRLPEVKEFHTAGSGGGGWGATIVTLHLIDATTATDAEGGERSGRDRKENAVQRSLQLETLTERLMIYRLSPDAALPEGVGDTGRFISITRTRDELSVVCAEKEAPPGALCNGPWRGIRVKGTLEFSATGVLHSLAQPLAAAGIPIFVVSTHDTDYLLVRDDRLDDAQRCLRDAGHTIDGE